ncbi:molybdopterin synthase sulfur carrier subunit-like [Parus major]|uniref:molybdopterin synthase sulfur carrier subunit-like n=1 Tax=Parus major TaxID=9157 RepID=UPI0007714C65|nr:molybdopterin synthase sulfur carrier subunit-like [Parus major]
MAAGLLSPPENPACKVLFPTLHPEFWGKAEVSPTFATTRTGEESTLPGRQPERARGPARPQGAVRARRRSPGRRRRRGPVAEGSSLRDGGSMRCQVSVLYFARSAELAGLRSETLSVPREITSLQLWEEIVKVHPRLAVIRDQVVFAVRQEYVLLGDQLLVLQPGDEVAIIPPISGG